MKNIVVLVSFLFTATYAALLAKDINALLERATELEAAGNKMINEFKNHSKGHLLSIMEEEIAQVEKIVQNLKLAEANSSIRSHELGLIEQDLLHHENRLNEEMDFVMDLYHYNATGKSSNELVNFGEKLIIEAKAELSKHRTHGTKDTFALKMSVDSIDHLIKQIQSNPSVRILEEDEVALVKNERTLRALLESIQAHQF